MSSKEPILSANQSNHHLLLILSNLEHGLGQYRRKMEMKECSSLDAKWCSQGTLVYVFSVPFSDLHRFYIQWSVVRNPIELKERKNRDSMRACLLRLLLWSVMLENLSKAYYSGLRYMEYQMQCENVHLLNLLRQGKGLTLKCLFCWFCALREQRVLKTYF